MLRTGVVDAGLDAFFFKVGIAQYRFPGLWQGKAHRRDQGPAGQAKRFRGMLEHRVSVAKTALGRVQGKELASLQINRVQGLKAVLQLDPVGTYVLHRRGADGARNKRHVFQARVALGQAPGNKFVPVLASTSLQHPGPGGLAHQPAAHDLDLEHHRFDIAGEHDVAAPTQHELGCLSPIWIGQKRLQVKQAAQAHQGVGPSHDMKGVASL